MNKFLFWIKGYVHASVPLKNAERFINILMNHNISAGKFCTEGERCCFRIGRDSFLALRPVIRKTGMYPKIHKKCGGYYVYRRMMKHSGLYLGIVTFTILLYVLSLFVWDIEFSGMQVHTEEQMLRFVNEYGIDFGCRSDRIDCSALESAIRKEFSDIGWVSVEIRGSRMMVRMKEAAFTDKQEIDHKEPSHIIAKQNGIVTGLIVRSGTPMVKVGDSVKKGDILIAGEINTVNEYNEQVMSVPTYADGDVCLKVELNYKDEIPLSFIMKKMTGNEKTGFTVSLFDKKIFSYIPSIPYERYDIITMSVNWKISKNLYLPVSHDTISCREYIQNEALYSHAQLSELSFQRYLDTIEEYLKDGYRLIRDDVKLEIIDDACTLHGILTLEGPFWNRAEVSQENTEGVTTE